ncbi:MAG: TonB-dependent receptor [Ignavibacteria bacterium]|nr:TonB-dependent receptor [Ignavibacteria bacterium]
MNLKNKLILIVLFGFIFIQIALAQESQRRFMQGGQMTLGKISGKIYDSKTSLPIEYANVVIFRSRDSVIINGTISDSEGKFLVDKIPPGRYFAKITFIGYVSKIIDNIPLTPTNLDIKLDSVLLRPKSIEMGEVVSTSEKEVISTNLDKKIINVDKNIASAGGTALDVMENIPSVTVDIDGNVSLRGNSNVTILIDGKPSGLFGLSSSDILNQIPASSIEYIELVTNPSVRYDPEGTSGIINIVLKKKLEGGFSGITSLNAGTKDKYNSSIKLNYKIGSFNFFGSYDNRFGRFNSSGYSDRISNLNNIISYLNQDQEGSNNNKSHNFNLGTDYNIDDKNTLTFSVRYRNMNGENKNLSKDETLDSMMIPVSLLERNTFSERKFGSLEYNLNFRKTFEERFREFTADLMYSDNSMEGNSDISQLATLYNLSKTNSSIKRSLSNNTNKMFLAQANYILPLSELGRVEMGFKSTIQKLKTKNDYENLDPVNSAWIADLSLRNYFDFTQQVHAIYGIYSNVLWGLKYQVGLRAEQVFSNSKLELTNEEFKNDYFSLYPSVHLNYPLSMTTELQLSYSRRVDRPGNRQLNPFVDISDSLNISQGNPYLKPQYINAYEFGFMTGFGKTYLTTNLFYRQTNGVISAITKLESNGVTKTTYENIAKRYSYGVEFTINQTFFDWWKLNGNISYFTNEITGRSGVSVNSKSSTFMTRLNNSFPITDDFQLQLIGFYVSPSIGGGGFMGGGFSGGRGGGGMGGGGGDFYGPTVTAQTKMKAMYSLDAAVRKDFFNGDLSVTLRVSDIFNTRKFGSETIGNGFSTITERRMDSRIVFLGISYRFNNYRQQLRDRNREEVDIEDF